MLITNATLNSLRTGVKAKFNAGFTSVRPEELWYTKLADTVMSKDGSETYPVLDMLPRLREWVDARQLRNLTEKAYVLKNKPYELSFAISVDDVEDDKFGNYQHYMQAMGRSVALWPNDLIAKAIELGGSTVCYDGQYFFDTDHPLEVQGAAAATQANLHTSRALTVANYATTYVDMVTRKGADGKPMGVRPTHLIVPAALTETGTRITTADILGYLNNNSSTAADTNLWKGSVELMVIPELDALSATTWYLADLSKPVKPFLVQIRKMPGAPDVLNRPTDEGVFSEKTIKVGVDGRGAGGYQLWQLIDKNEA